MKKVAIYTRVSTMEQANEGYSIDEQRNKLEAFCDINDWPKHELFVDAGVSGSTTNRPALKELMARLDEFELVLVYKLDRLTRNVRDLLEMLDVFEKNNVTFRSATEVYDTGSAMGRLFVTLVGAMAEWERSTISERTEMGKLSAVRQGVHVTKVPFYYDKVDGKLYPNAYAEVFRYMVKRVREGASTVKVADELNVSQYEHPNGLKWYPIMIRRALKSPQARGHSVYKDIYIKDTHEALISESEYITVLDKMKERTRFDTKSHVSIFRGKLKCHVCGSNLTLGVHHKNTKSQGAKTYKRYYCDKCKVDKVPKEQKISFSAGVAEEAFLDHLRNLDFDAYKPAEVDAEAPLIDIKKIEKQRKKYQEAWSMDLMTDDEFYARMEDTQKLADEYYSQIEKSTSDEDIDISDLIDIKESILKHWPNLDEERKEMMIGSFIKEIEYEYHKGTSRKDTSTIRIKRLYFYPA